MPSESEGIMPKNLNSTILASAWMAGSTDFQQAIPNPSQATMAEVVGAFDQPNAGKYFNEVTGLFNTIGMTRIQSRRWENPLEFLEGGYLQYGHSIREIAVKWVQAHCYDSNAQTLLKRNLPKFVEAFHSLDRFDVYDSSVSQTEFIQSLSPSVNGDGYGLDTLLGAIFDSMYSPEAYDSMRYTLQVLAEADAKFNDGAGLSRVNVPEPTNEESGKKFMETLEALALRWKFPSTIYNNVEGLPVFTNPDDLVILTTPEYYAALSIQVVAGIFQLEASEIEQVRRRIVLVPDFPIPNVGAVLADRNFWVIHRSVFRLENFYNPQQLVTNYYLHSQGVWSASPLANIVLLGDFESTEIPTVTVTPTTLTVTPDSTTAAPGGEVKLRPEIAATIDPKLGMVREEPDSVTWDVTATIADGKLNRNTFIDRFNVLHIQKSGIAAGDTIQAVAKSTYINPSGETTAIEAAPVTITIAEPVNFDADCSNKIVYTDKTDAVQVGDEIVDVANGDKPSSGE